MALAITLSDPGDNLDLTRDTPIWALVQWGASEQLEPIVIQGGEGVGINQTRQHQPAIYAYAQDLIHTNLKQWLHPQDRICVTIILPQGRALAQRTSNAAFGVVEGLSLLGTSGISQPLSAPAQLDQFQGELRQKAATASCLVLCVGENGLDIARQLGIAEAQLVKTANWLGPMLVEAGLQGQQALLLLGYHGKLLKLAGGIFHTHHHLADGRQEILTAYAAQVGVPAPYLSQLLAADSAENILQQLRQLDQETRSQWVAQVYGAITAQIEQRSQIYIQIHGDRTVRVGCALFDRSRTLFAISTLGATLLRSLSQPPP
jgi:cobalt-precorrin-5B (C1)-methyltransferase